MAFEAGVRVNGEIAVVDLQGEIDGSAEEGFSTAYGQIGAAKTTLLNFADVTYINSTGIAVIVGILAQARKAQVELLACGLSDHYKEIFEITRLVDFVRIFDDEASAVGAAT